MCCFVSASPVHAGCFLPLPAASGLVRVLPLCVAGPHSSAGSLSWSGLLGFPTVVYAVKPIRTIASLCNIQTQKRLRKPTLSHLFGCDTKRGKKAQHRTHHRNSALFTSDCLTTASLCNTLALCISPAAQASTTLQQQTNNPASLPSHPAMPIRNHQQNIDAHPC